MYEIPKWLDDEIRRIQFLDKEIEEIKKTYAHDPKTRDEKITKIRNEKELMRMYGYPLPKEFVEQL